MDSIADRNVSVGLAMEGSAKSGECGNVKEREIRRIT